MTSKTFSMQGRYKVMFHRKTLLGLFFVDFGASM
jgi:hypothetical protein